MHSKLADKVRISPDVWPGKELEAQPGDMSLFVPPGLGLSGAVDAKTAPYTRVC
mgnify:CR=1 FL=1